jgi:uncharacterized protein YcgI (DUF1989 family)
VPFGRQAGDTLYTASMQPIMQFLEDSGPGVHDTTAAACSYGLYVLQIGEVRDLSPLSCSPACAAQMRCACRAPPLQNVRMLASLNAASGCKQLTHYSPHNAR